MNDEPNEEATVPELPTGKAAKVTKVENPEKPKAVAAIPPCPDEDPLAGDKTPAVIAWWFKYQPAEAAVKYKNRKFQQPSTDV
jgi:hypothetical protein